MAAAQRLLRVIARFRFHADDLALRRQLRRGQRTAADQAAATDAHEQQVEWADFLDQLLRHGALARDHVGIVERCNQGAAALGDQFLGQRLAILPHAVVQDHLGAVAPGGGKLGRRRVARHYDRGRHVQKPRRQRYRLGMVAG